MEYFVVQIAVFLIIAAVAGVALGWWGARLVYFSAAANCRDELAGLRRNYEDATRENHALRTQLHQVEQALRKLGATNSQADYGEYLQTRKALENTRRQYESLLERLHEQEKTVEKFRNQLQVRKQELDALKKNLDPVAGVYAEPVLTLTDILPPELESSDDLTCIQGISQTLAGKLRALGIMTYRQIAEMGRDDISSIQRLIGGDKSLPIDEWVASARALFLQKHHQVA